MKFIGKYIHLYRGDMSRLVVSLDGEVITWIKIN